MCIFSSKRCDTQLVGPFKFGQTGFRKRPDDPRVIETMIYDKGGQERRSRDEGGALYVNDPGWVTLYEFRRRKAGRSRYWKKTRGPADFNRRRRERSLLRRLDCHPHVWV